MSGLDSLRSARESVTSPIRRRRGLPESCPGCGALTQDVDAGQPGFYTVSRKAVKRYLNTLQTGHGPPGGMGEAPSDPARDTLHDGDQNGAVKVNGPETSTLSPVCDRCHHLIYDSRGVPIAHPSIEAIADSVAESPFTKNHVYHVVDAADFPMSVIPSIYKSLSLAKPRSQNRRSQHSFSSKPSLSFIITRSDLLAPTKEMVDRMMPKFISILRATLGRAGRKLRLGNVHLVSAKRGWWTTDLKDSIWKRGGGNWLVGKFNVGKSNLFEVLFPKGSKERAPVYAQLEEPQAAEATEEPTSTTFFSESSLLPPPQPEVPFPSMPLVSSLPGTTASPIRLPFGNHKGELIDMPGLERGGLDRYVRSKERPELVMTHRPTVSQFNIKPGQSLLLGGGLVRITPVLDETKPSTIMMAYPFTPLKAHVTSTEKAIGAQSQQRESGIDSILAENAGASMVSAGRFLLQTDVTRSRTGSMIRAGANLAHLPFQVFATDILVEGVGWVEIVCQVRKSRREVRTPPALAGVESAVPEDEQISIKSSSFVPFGSSDQVSDDVIRNPPEVEIFTPQGKFIGQRPCLDIWQTWMSGKGEKTTRATRPRKSMSGAKKRQRAIFTARSSP